MLMPSFSDGHAHPSAAVSFLYAANLYGLERHCRRTRPRSASSSPRTPTSTPTRGAAGARPRTRASVRWPPTWSGSTTKPMALWSDGHHSLWVNQAALTLAGIDNTTPDPIGGVIERVPGSVATDPPVRHAVGHPAGVGDRHDDGGLPGLHRGAVQGRHPVLRARDRQPGRDHALAGRGGVPRVQHREGLRGARAGRRDDRAHPRVARRSCRTRATWRRRSPPPSPRRRSTRPRSSRPTP